MFRASFRTFLKNSLNYVNFSGHPQILHEGPAQVVEVEADDDDEGYRTSPGSGNSPQSNTESPPPKVVKKQPPRPPVHGESE